MKKIKVNLVLSALLLMATAASATWGNFVSTGTANGIGNPSCTPVSTGEVACAVRSSKSAMMVNTFNGASWGTWKSLTGSLSSDPSCTNDGAGKVYCAATATNGDLVVTVLNAGVWSSATNVTAALYSAPSCAEYIAGQVLCAARSASGGLTWSLYNGTAWSAFANLTALTVSAPSCTSDDNGGVICAVYTTGYATLVNRYTSTGWHGFLNLSGIGSGNALDCINWQAPGVVSCFGKGYQSAIFVTTFNGLSWITGGWSDFLDLDGEANDNVGCTSQATGQLVCGGIGIGVGDAAFFADVYNGSVWTGWAQVGGTGVGTPACAPLGTGQAVCVVMGVNNKLSSVVGP
jgi:hypothetical protein